MGWKEAQEQRKATSLNQPKDEDLVGRRVLNGLGLVERQLLPVCRRIFGGIDPCEGTWPLTKRLLEYAWRDKGLYITRLAVEVHTITSNKDVHERLSFMDIPYPDNIRPCIMTRLKSSKQSLTYTVWHADEIGGYLTPPYNVLWGLGTDGKYHTAVQDTAHFVEQYGPYDWSEWTRE